MYARVYLFLLV